MNITATVENDTIKLPDGVHFPDGTQVRVEPVDQPAMPTFYERFKDLIGSVDSGRTDGAVNVDHYLYGSPKREP